MKKRNWGATLLTLLATALCIGWGAASRAQTMTDVVTITIGGSVNSPVGGGFRSAPAYGAVSPAVTSNGYKYSAIYVNDPICRPVQGCTNGGTTFQLSGLSSNPGQSWLNLITGFGYSLTGASAIYSYSSGTATWQWGNYTTFSGSSIQLSITHGAPPYAYVDLKWQVIGVDYAPPGAKSNVNYGASEMLGTANMIGNTFKSSTSVSVSGDIGVNLFGFVNGGLTETTTSSYEQQRGTTSSITIMNTQTNNVIVNGPASSAVGVDHDYDVIWVWLNPMADIYVAPGVITFNGYAWNDADDAHVMEVQPLYVYWLKNPSLIPSDVAQRLARSWDTTGLGGLTTVDYEAILATDPFSSSSYDPNTDTTHRFDIVENSTIPYDPPPPGGQPITVTGSFSTQTTSSQGRSSSTSYSVGFELDFTSQLTVIAEVAQSIKVSNTWTTTDTWSSTINSQTGKTASYSITGPATSDHYTGPVSFQVWRDNVYGAFMFYPVE